MSRDNKTNILALFCYRSLLKDWVIGRAQKLGTGCRTLYRGESEAGRLRAWSLLSTAAPVQAVGVWHGRGDHDLSPRVHRHAWGRPESRAQVVAGVPTLPRSPQGPLIHEIVQITRHGRVRGVGDTIVLISTHPAATYLQGPRGSEYRRDDTATELDSLGNIVAKTRWYVYDGLGPVVGEVDPLGYLTSSPKCDVYGAMRANTGTASTKQGFVGGLGHVSDTEMGLIYMRARYYDPRVGRFILVGKTYFSPVILSLTRK